MRFEVGAEQSHERTGARARRPRWRAAGAGLSIITIAAVAFFGAIGLPLGTAQHPGPGAAPDVLSAILFILGIVVAIEGLVRTRIGGGK